MNDSSLKKPALPVKYRQISWLGSSAFCLYSYVWFFLFGYLAYLVAQSQLILSAKIVLVTLLVFMSGNGLHLLGWAAHEGAHFVLVADKRTNLLLGSFLGAALFFPTIGFGLSHWAHHRFTNSAKDPDTAIHTKYQTFWKRLLFARVHANRQYFKNMFSLYREGELNPDFITPFSKRELRKLANINVAFMALWALAYIAAAIINPQFALFAMILPLLTVAPTSGLRLYIEHTATGQGVFKDSRTYSSPFFSVLLFGNNYHLEHHLYPTAPCYRLPQIHHFLKSNGYLEECGDTVVRGFIPALKYTNSNHAYPTGQQAMSSAGGQL
ncbi:MAG TPA: fatty acid desaturase [Spongiibacteraceae bacterium]